MYSLVKINHQLLKPYLLAYGTFNSFECFCVQFNQVLVGEICYLPGYFSFSYENISNIWEKYKNIVFSLSELKEILYSDFDFLYDQVNDFAQASNCLSSISPSSIDIVSFLEPHRLPPSFQSIFKSKLSPQSIDIWIDYLCKYNSSFCPGSVLRLDANQSLSLSDLFQLFKSPIFDLSNIRVILEQPLHCNCIELYMSLDEAFKSSIILDESIDINTDLGQFVGFYGVKLKSCKIGSFLTLFDFYTLARKFSLNVVVGNGFGTGLSVLHEIVAFNMFDDITKVGFEGIGQNRLQNPSSLDIEIMSKLKS